MRFWTSINLIAIIIVSGLALCSSHAAPTPYNCTYNWSVNEVIRKLGWQETGENRCGGYYLEAPFTYPEDIEKKKLIITSSQFLFARRGTSYGQGKVTISRYGQQIIANKAYIYRDPETGEIRSIELLDNVTIREPSSLVIASRGSYDLKTKAESLHDILYRTAIYNDFKTRSEMPSNAELQQPRKIYQLSAWGHALSFNQDKPKIFEFDDASYSTCPPTRTVWQVKAGHLELNQDTGRGFATNARLLFKGIPVFYSPYINFPIDKRRKSGFLWPTIGHKNNYGFWFATPYYWNMAPNYDMTITPAYLSKRNVQITDLFRYLTPTSRGDMKFEILPYDHAFKNFQKLNENKFGDSTDPVKQSELRSLQNDSRTRKLFEWQNHTLFNDHWSANLDYNWVSDDYYLRDFSTNLNQITQNQLLQEGNINYKDPNWNFTTRIQNYQTLHPVDDSVVFLNQYARIPQVLLTGDYPDRPGGFDYFITNEVTRFNIKQDPGSNLSYPIGSRYYTQPGISRPIYWPYLTVTPRLQFSATQYRIGNASNPYTSGPSRTLPIFDLNSTFYFDRNIIFCNRHFKQTLEPQLYYVYIPYRNQTEIPIFDTTVNTMTYDQLFVYNRFSSIDRINDANQVTGGLVTRFIDQQTGIEKVKAAIGQIFYFRKRTVTLCSLNDPFCPLNTKDYPGNSDNRQNKSPFAGLLNYAVNDTWSVSSNTILNSLTNKVDNQSTYLHYQPPETQKIINVGYNFVRGGDVLPGTSPNENESNLSTTDLSMNWPVFSDWSATGRWTQNWNHHHLQNLLYGLQYDGCCWAIRFITGRTFTHLSPNNTFMYNTQFFVQFALKGLGTVPVSGGDPSQLLSNSISGYQDNFGRDF